MSDLYAATPPPECLPMVASSVLNSNVARSEEGNMNLMICDSSRTYFYAPLIRPVYFCIVDEDF